MQGSAVRFIRSLCSVLWWTQNTDMPIVIRRQQTQGRLKRAYDSMSRLLQERPNTHLPRRGPPLVQRSNYPSEATSQLTPRANTPLSVRTGALGARRLETARR